MGSSQESKTTIPEPTAQELDDRARARAIQDLQAYQQGYTFEPDPETGKYVLKERPKTQEEIDEAQFNKDVQAKIRSQLLGGPIDEETKQLVGEAYGGARTQGNQQLEQFVREMAGARGLDIRTDSPILKELALGKANLESSLGGAQAASLLDVGQTRQNFAASLNDFQNQLRQQAFMNRATIGDSYANYASNLAQERMSQASTSGKGSDTGKLVGAGIGAAGAVAAAYTGAVMM